MKTHKQKRKLAIKHGRKYRDALSKMKIKGISTFVSPFWRNRKQFIQQKINKK